MEEKQVAQAGSLCWNEACPDYGQGGKGNSIKNGKTDKGVQRYRCQTCKQTFTETKGTLFYRFLKAASALEDELYNFTRPLKTLRVEVANPSKDVRWQPRTPAMAAGLDFPHLDGEGAFDCCVRSTSHQHLIGRPPENQGQRIRVLMGLDGESIERAQHCWG